MVQVYSTILAANNLPLYNIRVSISLTDAFGKDVVGFVNGSAVTNKATATTDREGVWTADLIPNSLIIPENTVYTMVQYIGRDRLTHRFRVPDQPGPINAMDYLIGGQLSPVEAHALQLHIADTEKHGSSIPVPLLFSQPGDASIGTSGTLRIPMDGNLVKSVLSATDAPAGSDLVVNININGSVVDTLTIPDGQTTPDVNVLDISVLENDLLSVNTTSVGATTPAQNIVVQADFKR